MAKQLNVSLAFTADTSKAKQQLQDLQQSLNKIISSTNSKTSEFGLTKELAQATSEASKLKIMLESATTSSGTLDLGKFSQELKKSGLELKDYANTLQSLGPEGADAFAKLAQSITTANIPLKQTNKLLNEFATTMKNTVRWQFSSSMLHGFMGAVSGALGYAKDLDKSLNDIRIVTGYNIDQMAQFAVEANKAAKALSSTTTDYTNASLIYYQQGLTDEEVSKRTEITVKMANAAGQSAEKVSNQLTAVWNNFYDGSKSLEYYADVMTALGTATASSTDEIAGGLEKFAAIGQTIGLSYEYAASALATITSNTRQSEEVVGTALKTIFARIQGLNLGETLDDGTSLNKYSEALAKVGINIFDANGEIKKMDTLLDEMANKWDNISKAQQIALAQTVAGTRQYTQLIALMDNWDNDDADSMTANLDTAYGAMGALQEQADIYAESWEASTKRVKAAAEGIYDKLLDEKFFIEVNNILEETLGFVGNLIDGLGGLPGVLSLVASWMLKAFGSDIANSLERVAYNIKLTSNAGKEEIFKTRKQANSQLQNINDDGSISGSTSADIYKQQGQLQDELLKKTIDLESKHKSLTEEEQKQATYLLDQVNAVGQQIIKVAQLREKEELTTKSLKDQLLLKSQYKKDSPELARLNEQIKKIEQQKKIYSTFNPIFNKLRDAAEEIKVGGKDNNLTQYRASIKKLQKSLKDIGIDFELIKAESSDIIDPTTIDAMEEFFNIAQKGGSKEQIIQLLQRIGDGLDDIGSDAERAFTKLKKELTSLNGVDKEGIKKILSDLESSFLQTGKLTEEQIQLFKNFGIQVDESGKIIERFKGNVYTTADTMVALANIATNVASVFNSIKGLSDIWSNEDLSFGEKMISTLSTLGMVAGTLISTYDNFNKAKLLGIKNDIISLALAKAKNGSHISENALIAAKNGQLTIQLLLETLLNAETLKRIAIYALIAAAIATVVVFAKSLYDAYHEDAQGAKEAAEQAEMLTKRYEEAKNAAEELKSTISDWNDAIKALEDLDRNTKEYADALDKANEKAKELIETYGLWNDYHLEDGVIKFNDGVLEGLQQQANDKANKAENQMYGAKIYANQAQMRSETTNQKRDTISFGTGTYTTYQTTYQDKQYENYRQLTNDETQYIAEVASNLQDALGGVTPTAEQLQDELIKLSGDGKLGADALQHLSTIITKDTVSGFISLGDTMSEVAEANLYYAKQLLENTVEENYGSDINTLATKDGETDAGRYESILDIYTNKVAQSEADKNNNIDEQYATVEGTVKDIVDTGDLNDFLKSQDEKYIKAVLGKDYDGEINNDKELGLMYASMLSGNSIDTLTYKSGNGVGTVKDNKGNTIVDGVSDEVMRREIAKQIAMEKITADATESVGNNNLDGLKNALTNIIDGGSKTGEKYGADFSSAILDAIANENFETLDFSNLFSELSPEEMAELSGMDKDGILGMLNIKEEDLIAVGYNVDAFVAAFGNALDAWTYQLDTATIEERAGKIQELIKDLTAGSIITEETYNSMQEMGINVESYFTKMADGSYKLTGIAENLINLLNGVTTKDFIDKILEVESAVEYADQSVVKKYKGKSQASDYFKNEDGSYNTTTTELDSASATQDLARMRAEFLKTAGGQEVFGFSDEQAALLEKTSWTTEELSQLAEMMSIASTSSRELQGQLLSTATSLEDLQGKVAQMQMEGIGVDSYTYGQALIGLASNYDNCTEEIEKYQQALLSGNEVSIKAAEEALELSVHIGEVAKKYDLDARAVESFAKRLAKNNKELEDGQELSEDAKKAYVDMAVASQRLDRGIKNINDNLDDYKKILKDTNKDTAEFSNTMDDFKDNLADVFNVADGDMFSDTFAEAMLDSEDFSKALSGDVKALDNLRAAATIDIGDNIINDLGEAANAIPQKLNEAGDLVNATAMSAGDAWNYVKSVIGDGFTVGELNNQTFVDALNDMIRATGMTKGEIQSMLGSMGVSARVKTSYEPMETEIPTYYEYSIQEGMTDFSYIDENGETVKVERPKIRKMTVPGPPVKTMGYVPVYSLEASSGDSSSGGNIDVFRDAKPTGVSPTSTATNTNGGGGGGSSNSGPAEKKTTKDTRYKQVTDKISMNSHAMNKASKAMDGLYGKARINSMKEINALLTKELDLLNQKREAAKEYLEIDKKAAQDSVAEAAKIFGFVDDNNNATISFDIDKDGVITNYEDIIDKITTSYNQIVDEANKEKDTNNDGIIDEAKDVVTEDEQKKLDEAAKAMEKVIEAAAQVDETREIIIEIDERSIDIANEQLENNYNAWKETLELKLGFNESDLEYIEYQLGKIENSVYGMSEAIGLLSDKGKEYEDNLIILGNAYKELNTQFENGQISSARYYEELSELRSQIIENLEAIRELDEAVEDYYSNTLSMAQEEISKVIDLMDNATNVLDHYYSLMDLFGKQKDFDKIGKILNAQATVSENAYKASSEAYKMFRAEADARKTDYNNAITEGASQEEIDRLKNRWIEAENAAAEAQDRMLSDAEAWAEDLNSILENDLAKAADTLENALTGTFGSFDELISQLDRANSLQEEFLTTTNKIYETNKLIRNAQKEIDKTTNSAAKRELKNFINKTNELQQQGKLSEYELEIQQAKYDLLLAEIALKEAQNAKSTVRLQRDSEGNFGYVYTADQNAITDAQQKYEDAQNTLYNIGLEGANNYTQRYIETMSEMYDTLTEIQQRDDLTEEERKQARLEATNYYYQKLKDYSYLHQVALTTDSRVAADAWSKDFAWMTESTETWMTNVNTYTTEVDKAITSYLGKINAENGVAKSLESLAENTDTITKKSKELKDMIGDDTKGLIYALGKEFDAVHKNVLEYEALRKEMQKTIDAKESFANSLLKESKAAELIGSTVYYALNGQTLRFDNYNAETGEVLVSDPETGNSMWVDERLIASSNSTIKKEVGSKRDNLYNYNYTDIFGRNQNFNARRYSGSWDINHLAGFLKRNNYGFGDLDFFDYYNKGYLTDDEAMKHKDYGWLGFDTGGYTGEWGPYGKMAMLHEKELVLNQHDTENLLASMEFLTRVLEIIDLQSLNNQLGGSLLLPSTLNTESNTLEQNVHIEASFPNVVDHSEIELAFNDLINISSQYANRK